LVGCGFTQAVAAREVVVYYQVEGHFHRRAKTGQHLFLIFHAKRMQPSYKSHLQVGKKQPDNNPAHRHNDKLYTGPHKQKRACHHCGNRKLKADQAGSVVY